MVENCTHNPKLQGFKSYHQHFEIDSREVAHILWPSSSVAKYLTHNPIQVSNPANSTGREKVIILFFFCDLVVHW